VNLFSRSPQPNSRLRQVEGGYVLLTLLFAVSLLVIAATVVLPTISYQIRRDQEQEMIHRGVQYSRAIRAYYKKFGRYPTRLEDLENTNNLRFLRKRYKDPMNKNQDFRLLHYGEQGVTLAGGIAGGIIPGASAIGSPAGISGTGANGSAFGGSSFGGSSSSFGGSSFGGSSFGNSGGNSSGTFSQSSGFGGGSSSGFGSNSNYQTGAGQSSANSASGTNATSGTSSTSTDDSQPGSKPTDSSQENGSGEQQVAVGGPIVGVASVIKKTTIREFNHKKKYNEWQFLYDPSTDRGGLITTPYQPMLQGFGGQGIYNGQPVQGQPGNSSSPFGPSSPSSSPFGQPSGLSSGPGSNMPAPPPSNPPQ